jgi:CRP/FNR family transcriptional regulator
MNVVHIQTALQKPRAVALRRRSTLEELPVNADPGADRSSCANCALQNLCLEFDAAASMDDCVAEQFDVHAGECLYRAGNPATSIHLVRSGALMVQRSGATGRAVLGFVLPGETTGLDGLDSGVHRSEAIALAYSEICELSFDRLCAKAVLSSAGRSTLAKLVGESIGHVHSHVVDLCGASASTRLARFLLDLLARQRCVNADRAGLTLAMSRGEMASYLGMSLETASRELSALRARGIVRLEGRDIEFLDLSALTSSAA